MIYAFTTATFTPGGATGRDGPTLTQARTGLTGPEADNWKNNTEFFNTTNGIQLWTVPKTGFYRIQTSGAQGGTSSGQAGGRGTRLAGDFQLTQGEVIRILVGQQGQTGGHSQNGSQFVSAGGGASFVTRAPYNTLQSVLVIAGGGGGAANNTWTVAAGRPALLTTAGNSGQGGVAGGTAGGGGNGGDGSGTGPGGAGFTGNGLVDPLSGNPAGDNARSFVNGGRGGRNSRSWGGAENFGGFGGGGGGGGLAAGGGGGYSGGGGGSWSAQQAGGGGGSFNAGTEQINTADINTGHGFVVITAAIVPDGLSVNSNSVASGKTLTVTLTSQGTADGTVVPYTVSGVNSADINGASLTGNFVIVDNSSVVSFLITTTSRKTLSIASNGFTQTATLLENIYGLSLISEDPNILFSSVNFPLSVDLSSSANLTNISILNPQDLYKFYAQASDVVTFFTSLNGPSLIDLSSYNTGLLNITVLQTNNLYKHVLQLGDPVIEVGKAFISADFVSITNFNVPDPIPLTFPERWAG